MSAVAVLILRLAGLVFVLRFDQVGGVEEGALFGPDVEEGGLNARQNGVDSAEIDVPHHAAGVGTIHQQFNEAVVLQDRHAGLARASTDEDFAFQSMSPRSRLASSQPGSHCCSSNQTFRGS